LGFLKFHTWSGGLIVIALPSVRSASRPAMYCCWTHDSSVTAFTVSSWGAASKQANKHINNVQKCIDDETIRRVKAAGTSVWSLRAPLS